MWQTLKLINDGLKWKS